MADYTLGEGRIVDGADIGMIQSGGCFSFAAETFESLAVTCGIVREKFESDKAAQASVFGLVDHTHSAATNFSTTR